MSGDSGLVSLGVLRLQAQQKADQVNSSFITTSEWNQYLALSYKELYDLMVSAYGDTYFLAPPYRFVTTSTAQTYALPDGLTTVDSVTGLVAAPFYKLVGVDLQVSSSQDSWITLRRFEFQERNKYWQANTYNILGITNLKYKIMGSNLWLTTLPSAGQTIQLWYIAKPPSLQVTAVVGTTLSSTTVTCTDTSRLAVGMAVADYAPVAGVTNAIPAGATISSIVANTSFVMSAAATATQASYIVAAWNDATTFDGIAGWEEYVALDAAIKAGNKQEDDTSALVQQKAAMTKRILDMAPNRDAAQAPCVTDANSLDNYSDGPDFGGGSNW